MAYFRISFEVFKSQGFELTSKVYSYLITAFYEAGHIEKAQLYYKEMLHNRVQPHPVLLPILKYVAVPKKNEV